MPKIELRNLSVSYQNKKTKEETMALKKVSTSFLDGSFSVILGPSGSGKTTLLRTIAGLLPFQGKLLWDDVPLEDIDPHFKQMSFVSQEYVLYPHMTVFENIAFPLRAIGAPKKEIVMTIEEISSFLDIRHLWGRKPKELSGGQRQRVSLARAIAKKPSLYLFDEPLSNLEEQLRLLERNYIKEAVKRFGASALYVTHSLEEAFFLADRVYVLNEGELVTEGTPKELSVSSEPTIRGMINANYRAL